MSRLIPYLALASFPVASLVASNPMRFSWGLHHGFEPMPVAVRDKVESVDRYFYFVVYAVTAGFVVGLMSRSGVRAAAVGLGGEHWERNVAIGVAAGALLILIQILLARLYFNMEPLPTMGRFQRRSVRLSVLVTLVAAGVEEFWIAFCLVSMTATGHSAFISVTATAAVFGALHFENRLGGALSVAARGVVTALLFLWLGSLIPMVLFHFIGNLGNLYWLRRATQRGFDGGGWRPLPKRVLMRRPKCTCPKCGTLLKYEEIMPKGASFPCPSCGETLQVSDYYMCLIGFAPIFVPALILWALGLPWLHLIIVELVVVYPIFSWSVRYMKYVIPPKLEVDWPKGPGLHLRDR